MLYINKNPIEPQLLVSNRQENGVSCYDNLRTETKTAIRKSLLAEQGYLCAYCMKRISLQGATIEHYDPQSAQNGTDMSYRNMLGVCDGGAKTDGRGNERLTCDKHRGDTSLTVDPLDRYTVDKIKYKRNGIIFSDDPDINNDLDNTLNLNSRHSYLIANRKAVYEELVSAIKRNGGKSRAFLMHIKEKYEAFDENGKLIPYSGVALYYINKWLKSY